MIVAAVGSLASELAGSTAAAAAPAGTASSALAGTASTSSATPASSLSLEPAGASEALSEAPGASGVEAPASGPNNFGSQLTEAISSLESSQRSADSASQALATGTVKDPESAVVTVEDASLAMQLAAQIRSKATEAAQTIFQTQV
jgi:flagellar hook-basal body complex protein FliE